MKVDLFVNLPTFFVSFLLFLLTFGLQKLYLHDDINDVFSFIEIEYIITAIHRPKRSIEVPRIFELKNK